MILGRIAEDFDFESFVFSSYVQSGSDAEFGDRLDELGDELLAARSGYLADRSRADELAPDSEEAA